MVAVHLESALPSLFCLAALLFLPRVARQSLSILRALQVYDSQPCKNVPAKEPESSRLAKVAKYLPVRLPLFYLMAIYCTASRDLLQSTPLLATMRDATPFALLIAVVCGALTHAVFQLQLPLVIVSRRWNESERFIDIPVLARTRQAKVQANSAQSVFLMTQVGCAVISALIAEVSYRINPQSAIFLAAISGFYFVVMYTRFQASKTISFRSLCRGSMLFCFIMVATSFICHAILAMEKKKASAHLHATPTEEALSSIGVQQTSDDLAVSQFLVLYYALLWSVTGCWPWFLVDLAYRYDAAQAGFAAVSEEESVEIQADSQYLKDTLGRHPVLLSSAAVPRHALSRTQLPTYTAAFATVIIVQTVGCAIDLLTGWQTMSIFPTSLEDLPIGNLITFSPWPLLAYPIVLVVMMISVSMSNNRTFKSLWTYSETWYTEEVITVDSEGKNSISKEKTEGSDEKQIA